MTHFVVEVRKVNGKFKCPHPVCAYESESPENLSYHWRHVCCKKYTIETSQNQIVTMNSSHVPEEQGEEEQEIPDETQEETSDVDNNRIFIHEVNLINQLFSNFQ